MLFSIRKCTRWGSFSSTITCALMRILNKWTSRPWQRFFRMRHSKHVTLRAFVSRTLNAGSGSASGIQSIFYSCSFVSPSPLLINCFFANFSRSLYLSSLFIVLWLTNKLESHSCYFMFPLCNIAFLFTRPYILLVTLIDTNIWWLGIARVLNFHTYTH